MFPHVKPSRNLQEPPGTPRNPPRTPREPRASHLHCSKQPIWLNPWTVPEGSRGVGDPPGDPLEIPTDGRGRGGRLGGGVLEGFTTGILPKTYPKTSQTTTPNRTKSMGYSFPPHPLGDPAGGPPGRFSWGMQERWPMEFPGVPLRDRQVDLLRDPLGDRRGDEGGDWYGDGRGDEGRWSFARSKLPLPALDGRLKCPDRRIPGWFP